MYSLRAQHGNGRQLSMVNAAVGRQAARGRVQFARLPPLLANARCKYSSEGDDSDPQRSACGSPAQSQLPSPPLPRSSALLPARRNRRPSRSGLTPFASAAVSQSRRYGSPANKPQPWQVVTAVCAVAMLLCNFHRSVFTALLPLLAGGLVLSPSEVGLLQSSMLWGYLAGQIPAGKMADERGGERVLLGGLALWSLATAATAAGAAAVGASPGVALAAVLAARVGMGLFSSVIMPSISAVTAQWVPAERKAATLAMIYAFFNVGGVLGLIVAPHLAARSGWPSAFVTAAAGGVLWSVLGSSIVSRAGPRPTLKPHSRSEAPPLVLLSPGGRTTAEARPPASPTDGPSEGFAAGGQQGATDAAAGAASAAAQASIDTESWEDPESRSPASGAAAPLPLSSSSPPPPLEPPGDASSSLPSSPSLSPQPSLTISSLPSSSSSFTSTSSLSYSSSPYSSYPASPSSSSSSYPPSSPSSAPEEPSSSSASSPEAPAASSSGRAASSPDRVDGTLPDRASSQAGASTSGRDFPHMSAPRAGLGVAAAVEGSSAAGAPGSAAEAPASGATRANTIKQIAALCWCHCVIGWGFFVMQSWLPLYLQSLGVASLADAGLLASLPWLAAAFTATIAAGFADRLVRTAGTSRLAVRRGMHAVSTLGCAAALLPLAVAPAGAAALPPLVATLCLVGAVGCYGFAFGGFHAYIQDVAAADAGKVLGYTNTASTTGGVVGNLVTGWLLQSTGDYSCVFGAAVALYCSSFFVFTGLLRGEPISFAALKTA